MELWHEMLESYSSMALLWLGAIDAVAVFLGFVIFDFCKARFVRRIR